MREDFEATWTGVGNDRRTLSLSAIGDGSVHVEAEDRDERVVLYLELEDVDRLRAWCEAHLGEQRAAQPASA